MIDWNRMDLLEIVEALAGYEDNISSEEELSEKFDEYVEEYIEGSDKCECEIKDDEVMLSEMFNDWSDGMCKDGEIHAEQYDKYCYVGDLF